MEPLTEREHEVLSLIAEGLSDREIAERIGTTRRTVNFHVANILSKLRVPNRVSAFREGIRRGWIVVETES